VSKPLTRAEQREVDILLRGDHVYGQCWASRTLFHEVVRLRTALAAAEAKLADERKHADALDAALRDPDSITVERARAAHAARRSAEDR